jgi:hypothetical protein
LAQVLAVIIVAGCMLATPAAAQQSGGGGWQPGPGAVLDNTYQGFIDVPSAGATVPAGASVRVAGWVVDTSAEGWAGIDDIHVLQGSTVLARGSVGGSRPDVASVTGNPYWASSGFEVFVPAGALQAGPATLTVQAHTPHKGSWTKQVSVTVGGTAGPITGSAQPALVLTVSEPSPSLEVPGTNDGLVRGLAYDTRTRPELGSGVNRVQVYLDAQRDLPGSQFLGDAVINGSEWSLHWEPTKWNTVKHHVMFVYARSAVTGEERLVTVEFDISQ